MEGHTDRYGMSAMDTSYTERPGRVAASAIVLLCLSAVATAAAAQEHVVRVPVSGTVEMGLAPFIERTIEEAEAAGAAAVILEIETPGGRVDAAERITSAISRAELPVYAYVNLHAYSAGARRPWRARAARARVSRAMAPRSFPSAPRTTGATRPCDVSTATAISTRS